MIVDDFRLALHEVVLQHPRAAIIADLDLQVD